MESANRDLQELFVFLELANEMIRSVEEQYKKMLSEQQQKKTGDNDASASTGKNNAEEQKQEQEPPQREKTAAEKELWKQQLRGMFPNALMCPNKNCHYGPVVFEDCDDLASHHGEERNGVLVDNSCARHNGSSKMEEFFPGLRATISSS